LGCHPDASSVSALFVRLIELAPSAFVASISPLPARLLSNASL